MMLLSLPWYMVSSGFRFVVKFSRDVTMEPKRHYWEPLDARIAGLVVWGVYLAMGSVLAYVHWEHQVIFQTKYETMWHAGGVGSILQTMQAMMTPRTMRGYSVNPIDV